jgi:hypothetical protein
MYSAPLAVNCACLTLCGTQEPSGGNRAQVNQANLLNVFTHQWLFAGSGQWSHLLGPDLHEDRKGSPGKGLTPKATNTFTTAKSCGK